ncbi:MAG: TerD family protein [Bacillota bacterium]
MSVSLQKGQKVSLTKERPGLSQVLVGLGWDEMEQKKGGLFSKAPAPIDCDASAIMLKDGKFIDKKDLIYFGNLRHKSDAIMHMGDNLTGAGEGDDEQLTVNLSAVGAEYDRIVFVVNIYDCKTRKQHFGMIQNAFIRLVDGSNNQELFKYSLSENYMDMTAMIFGELYRHNDEWKFNAIGQATNDPKLGELVKRYM